MLAATQMACTWDIDQPVSYFEKAAARISILSRSSKSFCAMHQNPCIDEETAEKQLSIRFGHVGIPFLSPAFAMDESWEALEEAFGLPS